MKLGTKWAGEAVITNHTGVGVCSLGRRGSGHATSALGAWCSRAAGG